MNQWPQYVIEAVQGVVRPTLRRTVGAGEVVCALNLLRTTEATANDIAQACGLNVPQLKMRLAREGIKPRVRVRGGRGRNLYDWSQVRDVVVPRGATPRQFLEEALRAEIEREKQQQEKNHGRISEDHTA